MLFLASASPRRKELLSLLVPEFNILPADIDETPHVGEAPKEYVIRMAIEKAKAASLLYRQDTSTDHFSAPIFIASDTSVVVDDCILGKPESLAHSQEMLRLLSGRSHFVMTSLCIYQPDKNQLVTECVTSEVTFRLISNVEIEQYWRSGEPRDKAGSYGIQGLGSIFVQAISGSYSGIVGLPLFETAQLLKQFGIHSLEEMSHE
ncbi:Maf family nucleotide pyrophosphatase [Marinomonas sp. C2222]|uniref:dTTP/UTP pyrophosphatase n=1 Tax=Marinomonas sargassi TaxID=2984494 RepID=A0ABT2YSN1_9GAMM|nr:Maf family protein [Marinomonas sargassi]MCV2402902.1 Maf family nucleotide pyrophosphatase [Marinomonas sargassi]